MDSPQVSQLCNGAVTLPFAGSCSGGGPAQRGEGDVSTTVSCWKRQSRMVTGLRRRGCTGTDLTRVARLSLTVHSGRLSFRVMTRSEKKSSACRYTREGAYSRVLCGTAGGLRSKPSMTKDGVVGNVGAPVSMVAFVILDSIIWRIRLFEPTQGRREAWRAGRLQQVSTRKRPCIILATHTTLECLPLRRRAQPAGHKGARSAPLP